MLTFFFAFPSPGDAAAEDDSPDGGSTTDRARVVSPRRHRGCRAGARGRVAGVARASRVVVARASGARAGVDVGMFPSACGRRSDVSKSVKRSLFSLGIAIDTIVVCFRVVFEFWSVWVLISLCTLLQSMSYACDIRRLLVEWVKTNAERAPNARSVRTVDECALTRGCSGTCRTKTRRFRGKFRRRGRGRQRRRRERFPLGNRRAERTRSSRDERRRDQPW